VEEKEKEKKPVGIGGGRGRFHSPPLNHLRGGCRLEIKRKGGKKSVVSKIAKSWGQLRKRRDEEKLK